MNLRDCAYRLTTYGEDAFYCRHPRVHARHQLVSAAVCGGCEHQDHGNLPMRPVPAPERLRALTEPQPWQFISCEQLITDVRDLATRLPSSIDSVAGIPRSGMLPASVIAALLHIPLYEVSVQSGLRLIGHGLRLEREAKAEPEHLLLLDDSVFSGYAIRMARDVVRCHFHGNVTTAALYPLPETADEVDLYGKITPAPHLFEWNLCNCNQTERFAFDMDGVICEDFDGIYDDGPDYHELLENARPKALPRRTEIPLIVTARLERYRTVTERWLDRHGVRVGELIMGTWSSALQRRRHYDAGGFKGQAYAASRCRLFIESDEQQAEQIFAEAGKPVLCFTTGRVFQ